MITDHNSLATLLKQYFQEYTVTQIRGGATEAKLYRVIGQHQTYILKQQTQSLLNEYRNYLWLHNKVAVPKIIFYQHCQGKEYLCMTELEGNTLEAYKTTKTSATIVSQYAQALRLLHSLPTDSYAPIRNLEDQIALAAYKVKHNLVDLQQLQPENQSYTPKQLFEKLISLKPTTANLVFTHGDYCLDNLIYKDNVLSGFIDVGNGGVADLYQDLALAVRTIKDEFGTDMLPLFYQQYGLSQPETQKLEFFTLLDEFF